MTTYMLGGTSLTEQTDWADDDRILTLDSDDTGGAPEDANGRNKWMGFATAAKAFYKGAYLVLPDSGNSASTNATLVNNAISAAVTAGIGVVKCAPVAWNWEGGTVLHDGSGLKLDLEGCSITGAGSGALIEMYDSSTFEDRTIHGGGVDGDPWIDGSAMTGDSYAVHMGDIFEAVCNVRAVNFNASSGSKGVWFDNRYAICEALHARVFAGNCKAGVVFDVNSGATATGAHVNATGSFERSELDLHVNQGDPTYDLVVWQNGAFQLGGRNGVHGNVGGSGSTLTSAAVRITGSTPSGITQASDSILLNVELNWDVERDGADANSPYTVFFGGGSNAVVNCTGMVNFGAGSPMQSSNSGGQWVGFVGIVGGDANLPTVLPAGSTNIADGNQTISATSATAITSLAQDVAAFTAYKLELYIPHISTGASGTYTIALGGPTIDTASLDVTLWTGTTATPTTRTTGLGTGALLSTAAHQSTSPRALKVSGTVVFSAAGTLTVTGLNTGGGHSNLTVDAGAYLVLTPMSAP